MKKNDVILVCALLCFALIGALCLLFRESGNVVRVSVDGKLYGEFLLSENRVEDIHTDGHNRLVIRDGKAFVEEASCPDGICVSHRAIFRDGESIICLPNRVVITVVSQEADTPDIAA